jgi:hypothetical protein
MSLHVCPLLLGKEDIPTPSHLNAQIAELFLWRDKLGGQFLVESLAAQLAGSQPA